MWLTIWAEGRSEPVEGQIGIGCCIRTRVQRPKRFGVGYRGVCLKAKQFSCWNAGTDRNHVRLMHLAAAVVGDYAERSTAKVDPLIEQIKHIAAGVMAGKVLDNVAGADHYLTVARLDSKPPKWAKNQTPVAFKGTHAFLRLG